MSYLFISHSSKNDFESIALKDWLMQQGWDDVFLDLDPERGIVAGQRWERALHEAANRCDAVLFCVSQSWLESQWCRKEFRLAHRLNKRIIGLLIEDIPVATLPQELTETWQLVNLATGNDHEVSRVIHPDSGKEQHVYFSHSGLARLKVGLLKAGLDPLFYEWPPKNDSERSPYRGMAPLESVDAGIFFGRAAPINELLSKLRELRSKPSPRFMVILGASGAGKSSFLRAGILPRLSRDERHFLTLPIIRPEQSVLWGEHGLLNSLEQTMKDHQLKVTRAVIRKSIESSIGPEAKKTEGLEQKTTGSSVIAPLVKLLILLSEHASVLAPEGETNNSHPTIVITVDQGEELFQREGAEQSKQFLDLLTLLAVQTELAVMVLFTIRSDSFEQLQTYKALEGITQQTFSLSPMPQGAYDSVIEGPAARLKGSNRELKIEAALTQQILEDIEKGGNKDALPLLAFTMERLYLEYGSGGDLTLKEYQEMGGIEGAIEAAVELALDSAAKDPLLPNDRNSLTTLLRRGLIPWLAGIDPQSQTPRRRVANIAEIPAEARPMIDHLITQRLLATDLDQVTKQTTVEPAHEALLRQWGLLQGWLAKDFAALTTIESIQRASRDWQANDKNKDWLSHNSGRLEDAEEIKQRDDLSKFLKPEDWTYLNQCRISENEIRNKELNEAKKLVEVQQREANALRIVAKRTTMGMVAAVVLMVISGFLGWQALQGQQKAVQQRTAAERERTRAEVETEKALAVSTFMQSTFEAANPYTGGRKDIQLIEALNQSVVNIEKSFAKQPVTQAAVKHTVGVNYLALQDYEKAKPLLNDALALRIKYLEPNNPDIAESYRIISSLKQEQGDYEEAKKAVTKGLSLTKERVGELSMEIVPMLDQLVQVHLMMGEYDLAKASADQALKIRKTLNESGAVIAQGLHNRASVDSFANNYVLAKQYAEEALELRRKVNDLPVSIMYSLNLNANIAMAEGRYNDADEYYQEAIAISTQELGEKHGETAMLKENLGNVRYRQKRYQETLKLLAEVLEIRQATFGEHHDMVGRTNANMGVIYMAIEQRERAQAHLQTAFTIFETVLPPNHPNLAFLLTSLAKNEAAQGQYESAMIRLERARKIQIAGFSAQAWQVGIVEITIGETLISSGQTPAAKVWLIAAMKKLENHPDPANSHLAAIKEKLAGLEEAENIESTSN